MRKQGLKRFVLLSLLALLPVVLLVGLYVVKDPFHVLRPYDGNAPASTDSVQLTVNTCYVSTEAFRFFEPSRHFDSFIFGSSLSGYYRIKDWATHLPADASPFHFNASRETLHGILNKLNYLERCGVTVKHALIVMEDEMLKRMPLDNDVLYVQHPLTAPNVSWWKFHQLYFNAFRHPELVAYTLWPSPATTHCGPRQPPLNSCWTRAMPQPTSPTASNPSTRAITVGPIPSSPSTLMSFSPPSIWRVTTSP